jgi:hypothetical protein
MLLKRDGIGAVGVAQVVACLPSKHGDPEFNVR